MLEHRGCDWSDIGIGICIYSRIGATAADGVDAFVVVLAHALDECTVSRVLVVEEAESIEAAGFHLHGDRGFLRCSEHEKLD